jgi:uncharacterized membrane protein/protein-disulfide isomerase
LENLKNSKNNQRSWPWWRVIMTGLNTLALVLSAIMSWHFLRGGSMIGCGGGSPCEQVLNSPWSIIAGIFPVSGLAVGVYLALLVASLFIGPVTEAPIRRLAWKVILVLAGAVSGSAIWFTILQKWVIGDFCPYCMTTHITGLLLTALVIWRTVKDSSALHIPPLHAMGPALAGLALAGTLAAGQVAFTPSAVYRDGKSQTSLSAIDYHNAPMAGSPDAPYVVTLLFDYQCSHCQKIHFMLDEVIRRYNGKLAFVLCPAPLNIRCNPYVKGDSDAFKNSCELAQISLAVWYASHESFPAFENWMFTFESGDRWRPRSLGAARAKAVELVGQEKLDAALADPWIGRYLQSCIQLYGQTIRDGMGGVPKLIFGSGWVIPEPYDTDELIMILQKSLAVPRP